jgi:hypothetical protein
MVLYYFYLFKLFKLYIKFKIIEYMDLIESVLELNLNTITDILDIG